MIKKEIIIYRMYEERRLLIVITVKDKKKKKKINWTLKQEIEDVIDEGQRDDPLRAFWHFRFR